MKKTLFVLSLLLTILVSCTDGNADVKKCWEFTITQVAEYSMGGEVMNTQTITSTVNKCGLTADEAKAESDALDGVTTTTADDISIKMTITVTYKETAEE